MRIALAVEGTRGDVYPMLALATRLQRAGHDPVICAPAEFADVAAARGLEFRAVGSEIRSYLTQHAADITTRGPRGLRVIMKYFKGAIHSQFASLPAATADVDLIVGAGVQVAASSAAELHGVPYRYLLYCPAMLPSADHAPAVMGVGSLPRWLNRGLWWAMEAGASRLLAHVLNGPRAELGLPPVRDALRHVLSAVPIVAADALLAPAPRDSPIPSLQIDYLSDVESPPLPEKLEAFLEAGSPPVYFGFGSMTDADPGATTLMLVDAASRAGFRAVISQGWAGLAGDALPEQVMSIGAVSHARLFPRVAAVVHHGGAGTTTATARAGVPQIIVPHLLDQYFWRDRVRALGLGSSDLRRRNLNVESLTAALLACRDNELLADRARELGAQICSQLDPERDLQRLLDDPGGPSLSAGTGPTSDVA